MTQSILLIGANGQVGRELQPLLSPLGDLVSVGRTELDLTATEKIRETVRGVKPRYIINAAAYTAVDKAETETDLAFAINETAPRILAEEAEKSGATLIHISTDYVFDGTKNTPYTETDPTNPIGVYGKSKLAGEEAILSTGARALILRTAWVYGVHGKVNFVKTMLRLGGEREVLKVVVDQVGSPTWAADIASAIVSLLNSPAGVYHFTNSGVASWFDFTKAIFAGAKLLGYPLTIKEVIPIITSEYPTPARRPAYSVLSDKKIAPQLGHTPAYWRDSLNLMLKQLSSETL